jgi:hypothetical protein
MKRNEYTYIAIKVDLRIPLVLLLGSGRAGS